MGRTLFWKLVIYDFTFTWYLNKEHKNILLVILYKYIFFIVQYRFLQAVYSNPIF
jgi:hypothetical protein